MSVDVLLRDKDWVLSGHSRGAVCLSHFHENPLKGLDVESPDDVCPVCYERPPEKMVFIYKLTTNSELIVCWGDTAYL
jgi:hypothetical protein